MLLFVELYLYTEVVLIRGWTEIPLSNLKVNPEGDRHQRKLSIIDNHHSATLCMILLGRRYTYMISLGKYLVLVLISPAVSVIFTIKMNFYRKHYVYTCFCKIENLCCGEWIFKAFFFLFKPTTLYSKEKAVFDLGQSFHPMCTRCNIKGSCSHVRSIYEHMSEQVVGDLAECYTCTCISFKPESLTSTDRLYNFKELYV